MDNLCAAADHHEWLVMMEESLRNKNVKDFIDILLAIINQHPQLDKRGLDKLNKQVEKVFLKLRLPYQEIMVYNCSRDREKGCALVVPFGHTGERTVLATGHTRMLYPTYMKVYGIVASTMMDILYPSKAPVYSFEHKANTLYPPEFDALDRKIVESELVKIFCTLEHTKDKKIGWPANIGDDHGQWIRFILQKMYTDADKRIVPAMAAYRVNIILKYALKKQDLYYASSMPFNIETGELNSGEEGKPFDIAPYVNASDGFIKFEPTAMRMTGNKTIMYETIPGKFRKEKKFYHYVLRTYGDEYTREGSPSDPTKAAKYNFKVGHDAIFNPDRPIGSVVFVDFKEDDGSHCIYKGEIVKKSKGSMEERVLGSYVCRFKDSHGKPFPEKCAESDFYLNEKGDRIERAFLHQEDADANRENFIMASFMTLYWLKGYKHTVTYHAISVVKSLLEYAIVMQKEGKLCIPAFCIEWYQEILSLDVIPKTRQLWRDLITEFEEVCNVERTFKTKPPSEVPLLLRRRIGYDELEKNILFLMSTVTPVKKCIPFIKRYRDLLGVRSDSSILNAIYATRRRVSFVSSKVRTLWRHQGVLCCREYYGGAHVYSVFFENVYTELKSTYIFEDDLTVTTRDVKDFIEKGIKVGDKIVGVDFKPVNSMVEFDDAMSKREWKDGLFLSFARIKSGSSSSSVRARSLLSSKTSLKKKAVKRKADDAHLSPLAGPIARRKVEDGIRFTKTFTEESLGLKIKNRTVTASREEDVIAGDEIVAINYSRVDDFKILRTMLENSARPLHITFFRKANIMEVLKAAERTLVSQKAVYAKKMAEVKDLQTKMASQREAYTKKLAEVQDYQTKMAKLKRDFEERDFGRYIIHSNVVKEDETHVSFAFRVENEKVKQDEVLKRILFKHKVDELKDKLDI